MRQNLENHQKPQKILHKSSKRPQKCHYIRIKLNGTTKLFNFTNQIESNEKDREKKKISILCLLKLNGQMSKTITEKLDKPNYI